MTICIEFSIWLCFDLPYRFMILVNFFLLLVISFIFICVETLTFYGTCSNIAVYKHC